MTGYGLYFESIRIGSTTQTSSDFSGLSCGTSYTLGVDAFDEDGNRSTISSLIVSTDACPDTSPPTAPTNLQQTAATASSVAAGWTASTDNVGVTGYRVFVDSTLAGTTTTSSYTLSGLSCGTSHLVVVDAYDAAGNRSAQASATLTTSACPAPAPGDSQPPTTPAGLTASSPTQTTVALSWTASSDNVGVSGYGVYSNGSLVATPASTSYTLSGLSCGTSYTVAVDAYDAAGNRSAKTTVTTATSSCPDTTPPTTPTGLTVGSRTTYQRRGQLDGVVGQRRCQPVTACIAMVRWWRRRPRPRTRFLVSAAGPRTRSRLTPTTRPGTVPPRPRSPPLPAAARTPRRRPRRPG